MAIVTDTSAGLTIAKAIGLDPKNLHSFKLEVTPNDVITVTAVYFVTKEGCAELEKVVKKFTLKADE